jgi:hypothetical protein
VKAIELYLPVISDTRIFVITDIWNPSWMPILKDGVLKDVRYFQAIDLSPKSGRIDDMIVVIDNTIAHRQDDRCRNTPPTMKRSRLRPAKKIG